MTVPQQTVLDGQRIPSAPVIIASGHEARLPNDWNRYFAFPLIARISDGRLVLVWQDNQNHFGGAGSGGRVAIGNAAGTTFGTSQILVPEPDSDTKWWAPVGIAVRGSRIAVLQTVNQPNRQGWFQSTTNPNSWPAPTVRIQWPIHASAMPCHLAWIEDGSTNGRLLATAYWGSTGVQIMSSTDNGATWSLWSTAAPGNAGWSESTITRTARGDLLMLQRKDAGVNADTIHARWSVNNGQTWSPAVPVIPAASGMPTCTLLPDGRLVATIRDLAGPGYQSHSLAWSSDHGATWTVTPVASEWMMYGQVVVRQDGTPLLAGGSQVRGSSTLAHVWTRAIRELVPVL